MRKSPGKHTIEVTFEAKWGVSSRLVCHEPVDDPERPCWSHTEEGEPYPFDKGVAAGCVYIDWWENDGMDCLGGPDKKIAFDLADAEWDGDGFTFILGDQIGRGTDA